MITFLYMAVCILFSLIIHECAHAYVALRCGDPTAKYLGRLTLDPRKHLDPIGTVCMLLLRVGWAKPVPINPRNFRNYRRDYILVSLAGITVNLLVCLLSLAFAALLSKMVWNEESLSQMRSMDLRSAALNIYKYSPAYMIYSGDFFHDSSWISMMNASWAAWVERLFLMLAQMNLGLAVFNLLPVPPLDGYRVMDEFVFRGRLNLDVQTMRIIQIIFMVVCFSGTLSGLLSTVNGAVFGVFSDLFALLI